MSKKTSYSLVEQLKDNPNVDYAEPNYIYGIDDFEVGDVITAEEASKMRLQAVLIDVNDPLYPHKPTLHPRILMMYGNSIQRVTAHR